MSRQQHSNGLNARKAAGCNRAVLFIPFWRMAGHVGNNRIDRFVRWLSEDGYEVVIVCAGEHHSVRFESWGQEITVVDRLGLHPEAVPVQGGRKPPRSPNKLRRWLVNWIFNPDPGIVWACAAARHQKVIASLQGARFILSSSPSESSHVGAWLLSQKTSVPHIVDLRDGWLDEPLKPLLHTSGFRHWLESRLEARILHDAALIQVTSGVWRKLLIERLPSLKSKVSVLTNGYPKHMPESIRNTHKNIEDDIVLIHAGRLMGSRFTQLPKILLEPLLENLSRKPVRGVIRFIGSLSVDELHSISIFEPRFAEVGWRIECVGSVARDRLLELLWRADGLLLLSASNAAIPSKIFEYIPTGLPIFMVTLKGSAVWQIGAELPQVSMVDMNSKANNLDCDFYLKIENKDGYRYEIPSAFSEDSLKNSFLTSVAIYSADKAEST